MKASAFEVFGCLEVRAAQNITRSWKKCRRLVLVIAPQTDGFLKPTR